MRRREEENGKSQPCFCPNRFWTEEMCRGRKAGSAQLQTDPTAARLWQESWGKNPVFWDVSKLFISYMDKGIKGTLVA